MNKAQELFEKACESQDAFNEFNKIIDKCTKEALKGKLYYEHDSLTFGQIVATLLIKNGFEIDSGYINNPLKGGETRNARVYWNNSAFELKEYNKHK